MYEPDHAPPLAGVRWLIDNPGFPTLLKFDGDDCKQNLQFAQSFYQYICTKHKLLPTVCTITTVDNWKSWLEHQRQMWCAEEYSEQTYLLPTSYMSRTTNDEDSTNRVVSSERREVLEGVQIIQHDSGDHGSFTAAEARAQDRELLFGKNDDVDQPPVQVGLHCLYTRINPTISQNEHVWLGKVVAINVKDGETPTYDIQYCPSVPQKERYTELKRKRLPPEDPLQLSARDKFVLDYKVKPTTARSSKRQQHIEKEIDQSCLNTWNIRMNQNGCINNSFRPDHHFGKTSLEVVEMALENFYNN